MYLLPRKVSLVALRRETCIELFRLHRLDQHGWLSWAKTRTQHRFTRLALRSHFQKDFLLPPGHQVLNSSSKSIPPISDSKHRITVILHDGPLRESFSGTPYRVVNQVILFLTTGMSGDTLRAKSSLDLMREVASSSYASALLQRRTAETERSTLRTASSKYRIPHHEGTALEKIHSQEAESFQPSMQDLERLIRGS